MTTENNEKDLELPDLNNFPHPADDDEDPPVEEDWEEDFQREGQEEAGLIRRPYKTIPFWLSILACLIAYVLASGFLPEDSETWSVLIFMSTTLAYFGYDHALKVFENHRGQLIDVIPNYKKPAFYLSFLSTMTSYSLGSGMVTNSIAWQITGVSAMIFAHIGVNILPWIKRTGMADPEEDPEGFFAKLAQYLYSLFYTHTHPLPEEANVENEDAE